MISERLKELRVKNKKTQSDLADLLGISRQGYSKYENGKSVPDANMLNTLSDYYEVSADYILCRTLNPNYGDQEIHTLECLIDELKNSNEHKVQQIQAIWNIIK